MQLHQQSVSREYISSDLTAKIIACSMQVHSQLGNGFQASIYKHALAIELTKMELSFVREMKTAVYYDHQKIGNRWVDFFVEDKITVEIKTEIQLLDFHVTHAIHNLEACHLQAGLLINFGNSTLQYKSVQRL